MSFLSRAHRRVTGVAIAFIAALCVAPAAHAASAFPAFYTPPSPLPAGKPGDLIRAERIDTSKAIGKPPVGTAAWRIMYLSTSAMGQPIAVTGTVMLRPSQVPTQGVANRPLISYGNEFQGLGDNCAVSRQLQYGSSGEIALIAPLLERGYAVASSDLEGLGTPGTHTFGVTISMGHVMLDIIRAARQLQDANLPQNGPLALYGYSEGGGGVGGAAEMASTYAPELKFTAAAFGGAPADLLAASKNIDGGPAAGINFVAAAGYDAAYPELHLSSYLNILGKAIMPQVYQDCIQIIPILAFQWFKNSLTRDIRALPAWQARFAENRLGNKGIPFQTYYFHSTIDETEPYADATALRARYCDKGTKLRFVPVAPWDHIAAGPQWMPTAAAWLAARLQGVPDAGNCGQSAPLNG